MAIEFEKEKKKQKYLIGVVIVIIAITSIILWRGYFSEVELPEEETATSTQPQFSIESLPQIDFNILEANILEDLNTYPSIEGIDEEEIGRENPFLPY